MHHQVKVIETSEAFLVLAIDGKKISFSWGELSSCLGNATKRERNVIEISPSGYGIRWPILDEDLSIDGMLGIDHAFHHYQDSA